MELPVATWRVWRQNLPVGGGAYLRILPYSLLKNGVLAINKNEKVPAVLYLHPWEIDDSQPRLNVSWKSRVRQYTGLTGMKRKVERLLQDFTLGSIYDTVFLPLQATGVARQHTTVASTPALLSARGRWYQSSGRTFGRQYSSMPALRIL